MAVAALKGPLNYCEHHENVEKERITSGGRRRVFVQTEAGFVVGLELDRSDNAHTVKRRLQLALNVPTEETSLVCGDLVLKHDLSSLRNDAPLLLTRNGMQRSSSTPCLSPSSEDAHQNDQSGGPIEIIGSSNHLSRTKELVKEVGRAIQVGVDPIPISGGLGGVYYFKNCDGENVAIVKPTDEEPLAPNNPKGFVGKALGLPGLKRSVRVGETGFREVAAFLLDYDSFANVPITALVRVTHSIFNVNNDAMRGRKQPFTKQVSKIASFQQYIPHDFDASDHGTSSFPVSSIHRIGILDIRILNTDRHAGNLLVRKHHHHHHGIGRFDQVELIPIDHGLCLPEDLEDPYFEWIHWPQASIPFSEDELEYINNLDPFCDIEMLRMELPVIREACLRVLIVCTFFLKEATRFGLCLAEIGDMMSRDSRGRDEEEPSELELICIQAKTNLLEVVKEMEPPPFALDVGSESDDFQFILECEDTNFSSSKISKEKRMIQDPKLDAATSGSGYNTLFRLEESDEDEVYEDFAAVNRTQLREDISSASKISSRPYKFKAKSSCEQQNGNATSPGGFHWGRISSGNRRSVDEKLPSSSTYVKLGDMNEEEWLGFLDHFQKLLYPAFVNRRGKWNYFGFRQRQRLGTSCKF